MKQLKEIRQNAVGLYAEGTTSQDYDNWSMDTIKLHDLLLVIGEALATTRRHLLLCRLIAVVVLVGFFSRTSISAASNIIELTKVSA